MNKVLPLKTAQSLGDEHEIELPPPSPIDPVDHEAPESVVYTAVPGCVPTAMHSVADGQATSSSALAEGGETASAHPLKAGAEVPLPVPLAPGLVVLPMLVVVRVAPGGEDDPQAERARLNMATTSAAKAQVLGSPLPPGMHPHLSTCTTVRLIRCVLSRLD